MNITITNQTTGETITIERDVTHNHPAWVHEQLETESEAELQAMMDQFTPEAKGQGPDCYGVEVS